MIIVAALIWIDHFRAADPQLTALLTQSRALTHPCVIGEIALGSFKQRAQVLRHLNNLPAALHRRWLCRYAWARDKTLRAAAARCSVAPRTAPA